MTKEIINGKEVSIYTWPNPSFPFHYYFKNDKCRIFILENISHNFLWLKEARNYIRTTDYFFVISGWYANKHVADLAKTIIDHLMLDKGQFIVMCNDFKELQHYLDSGFTSSIILNHNAWLDENLYKTLNLPKAYDAILIGRADKCKRLSLANQVKNLALVTGQVRYGNDLVDLPPHINNDDKRLNLNEIIEIINKSRCGLCLSSVEGACYSSSEYLLCGIPVVSTSSLGGRDIWYEEDNSIICGDSPNDIENAVEQIKKRTFHPDKIRKRHISLSNHFRTIFVNKLNDILRNNNITDIDAKQYFEHNYVNKMKSSSNNDEVIRFLKGDASFKNVAAQKVATNNLKINVIVSHYEENLDWIERVDKKYNVFIYSKTNKKYNYMDHNKGQEVPAYLKYIIDNYNNLGDKNLFVHGHEKSWHQIGSMDYIINNLMNWDMGDFFAVTNQWHNTDKYSIWEGCKEKSMSVILDVLKNNWFLFEKYLPFPNYLSHSIGGQFQVDKKLILRYPKEYYEYLYNWVTTTPLDDWFTSRIFEEMWHYLFTGEQSERKYNLFFGNKNV